MKMILNNLVIHLTNEIPILYKNQRLLFYIPYHIKTIKLVSHLYQVWLILLLLIIENIIKKYQLTLLEQKILFNDYQFLNYISFEFIN